MKTTKNSIYVTDKFKQSIAEINLRIEKQEKIRENTKSKDELIELLKVEADLHKEKSELIQKQLNDFHESVVAKTKSMNSGDSVDGKFTSLISQTKVLNNMVRSLSNQVEDGSLDKLPVLKIQEDVIELEKSIISAKHRLITSKIHIGYDD